MNRTTLSRVPVITACWLALASLTIAGCQPASPPGEKVLFYEVDPTSKTSDKAVNIEQVVAAVQRRIDTACLPIARVETLRDERLKITVIAATEERIKQVTRAVEAAGTLEFRIVAHNRDHKELIERAQKDDVTIVYEAKADSKDKKWLARWVPVKVGNEADFTGAGYDGIGKRERKLDADHRQLEILVIADDFNVTGDYLTSTRSSYDEHTNPCVYFSLNKRGGELFQALTSSHLPVRDEAFTYKLGIILDGCLVSAPSIQSTISDRGQITGRFTKEEVEELVNVLNAGALPAKLKRVAEEPGFTSLFSAEGAPEGWSVRPWNDLAKTAEDGVVWKVKDGILHGSASRGSWLVSDKEYGDFELRFEFKLGKVGNSGCALRAPLRGDPAFDGMELQMADFRYNEKAKDSELTGGIYRAIAPLKQVYKPEEWNRYEITLKGSTLKVVLNGEVIHDTDLAKHDEEVKRHNGTLASPVKDRPRTGHIGFQELSRGDDRVQIRNARIKVLE